VSHAFLANYVVFELAFVVRVERCPVDLEDVQAIVSASSGDEVRAGFGLCVGILHLSGGLADIGEGVGPVDGVHASHVATRYYAKILECFPFDINAPYRPGLIL